MGAPRFYADKNKVAIYDSAVPDALTSPTSHIGDVFFHSSLDYLEIGYEDTFSLTLPARPNLLDWTEDSAKHNITNHGLGTIPFGILLVSGEQMSTLEPLQLTGSYERHVALGVSSTQVWIQESWYAKADMPAITRTFDIYLLRDAPDTTTTKALSFTSSRLLMGGGKFDTNRAYLRQKDSSPAFWMTKGRTIDTSGSGIRHKRPNGTQVSFQSYSGSFTGDASYGINV